MQLPNMAARPNATAAAPATGYNQTEAMDFLHFSQVAYCPAKALLEWSCSNCNLPAAKNVSVFSDESTDTQAYVSYLPSRGRVVVGFRGTNSLTNWIDNLKFAKTAAYARCDGCEVHDGFLNQWNNVADQVTGAVEALLTERPESSLYLTGHSSGGALSVLAAAHFSSINLTVRGTYTFGEPRVGNDAFAKFYDQYKHASWRLTHYKDPVPHLPMMSLGFAHTAIEVFYNKDSTSYKVCDASGEDSECSDGVAWDSLLYVEDHHTYLGMPIDDPKC